MKNNKYISGFLSVLLLGGNLFLSSCSKEKDNTPNPPHTFGSGVFVSNEGQFGKGNGSVSFISKENKEVEGDVYMSINSRPLGDVVQSMIMQNGKAYIAVNNSEKIEVADANTFMQAGVISGLKLPSYMAALNNKLYVTEWVASPYPTPVTGRVAVIDLATNTVSNRINVGKVPGKVLLLNNKLYVVNTSDNTVSVINTATEAVEATITVGDNPNSLALDANNKIWVLCGGKKVYDPITYALDLNASTAGSLVRLNPAGNNVETTLTFASKEPLADNLNINSTKSSLFYNYDGKVYRFETSATALPTTAFIKRRFYGLGVDLSDNSIYGSDAGNYTSKGKVIRYNPNGQAADSFTVGIAPGSFMFK